jgi:two-component system sensor histidine kinase PilS (NtrC family)
LSAIISEKLRSTEAALTVTTESLDRLAVLYKQIFHDIGTGIITVNHQGEITSFNPASEDITGYRASEVIGKNIATKFPGLEATKHFFLRPVANLTRKEGNTIPVGYSWAKMSTHDGQESIVFTMQDLSQIRRMEEQVRQAEKMATIGGMAAGIAHEFRNPLASISGAAQFLRQEFEETSPEIREKLMTIIIRECDRLEKTVDEFLQFSKPITPNHKWFFLKDLTDEVVLQLQKIQNWPPGCAITVDIPRKQDCWADEQLIKQILFNLVENAANALKKEGGEIRISAVETKEDTHTSRTCIQVTDNGRGIPEEIRDKICEPFFTTRENGTGLGLSIVKQIIDSHGGSLQIRSQAESGTTVEVILPLPSEQEELPE